MSSKAATSTGASSTKGASSGNAKSSSTGTAKSTSTKAGSSDKTTTTTKKKVRKRKPGTSSSSKSSGGSKNTILADARSAQAEWTSARALEAARKKDPLWYRTSEVLQAISADATPTANILSEQVDLVESALRSNLLTRSDVTPQAFGVLLEQARRYALDLVADAQDCAYAAHRHDIARNDLLVALELKPDHIPHSTHAMAELQKMAVFSHKVNKIPLPPIPDDCYSGIVLPPKPHQLTARTFDVVTGAQIAQRMSSALPRPKESKGRSSSKSDKSSIPSHGATRGTQIPIQLTSTSKTAASDSKPSTSSAAAPVQPSAATGGDTGSGIKRKANEM